MMAWHWIGNRSLHSQCWPIAIIQVFIFMSRTINSVWLNDAYMGFMDEHQHYSRAYSHLFTLLRNVEFHANLKRFFQAGPPLTTSWYALVIECSMRLLLLIFQAKILLVFFIYSFRSMYVHQLGQGKPLSLIEKIYEINLAQFTH